MQVIGFTTAAKQLIIAAKNITKIRMPTLIELVDRLYEDLNLPQLIRHAKRRNMSTPIIDGKYYKIDPTRDNLIQTLYKYAPWWFMGGWVL